MILKILITISIISIFLIIFYFYKIISNNFTKNKKEEDVIDLEKDPKTNEYKAKK